MANIRIKDLSTDSALSAGDYVVVVSASEGSRKFDLGTEIANLKEDIENISGISDDVKTALLAIAANVGYQNGDGTEYYQALHDALYPPIPATAISLSESTLSFQTLNATQQLTATLTPEDTTDEVTWSSSNTSIATVSDDGLVTALGYGSATITATAHTGLTATCSVTVEAASLSSIDAVYTQSGTVTTADSLDSLKTDLVVTANWSDSSSTTVASEDYTLSGTLTVGTSTITVSYGGKTDTFTVTVSAPSVTYLYNWDLTQSLVDSVDGKEITLQGNSLPTQNSNGLSFSAGTQRAYLGEILMVGKTIEIDVASFSFAGDSSHHIRFLMNAQYTTATSKGIGSVIWKSGSGWTSYGWTTNSNSTGGWSQSNWITGTTSDVINTFNGKTVKVEFGDDGHTNKLYIDNELIGTINDVYFNNNGSTHKSDKLFIGGLASNSANSGDQCYNMTITGIRIYENV